MKPNLIALPDTVDPGVRRNVEELRRYFAELSETVRHPAVVAQTADDHHAKTHNHNSTDGSGHKLGGASHYTEVEDDGTLRFVGDATVYNEIMLPVVGAKLPATNTPTWASFTTNLGAYTFAVGDYADLVAAEALHGYLEESDIEIHVNFVVNGTVSGGDKGVKYRVYYSWGNEDAVMSAEAYVEAEATIADTTADLTHVRLSLGTVTGTGYEIGALLKVRIERVTATGTAPAADPFVEKVGVHYQLDTVGSRSAASK